MSVVLVPISPSNFTENVIYDKNMKISRVERLHFTRFESIFTIFMNISRCDRLHIFENSWISRGKIKNHMGDVKNWPLPRQLKSTEIGRIVSKSSFARSCMKNMQDFFWPYLGEIDVSWVQIFERMPPTVRTHRICNNFFFATIRKKWWPKPLNDFFRKWS